MDEMVWGWKITAYIWIAGLAGGTYMCAILVNLWDGRWHRESVRAATFLTVPLLLIGAALLTADLGQPARFWHLLAAWRPGSPMWLGTYVLVLGSIVGGGLIIHEAIDAFKVRLPGADTLEFLVTWLGLIFAAVVATYVAVLLTSTSRVFWSATPLLPALFVVSALSMGAATILIFTRFLNLQLSERMATRLRQADAIFVVFELAILAALMVTLVFSSTPLASKAAQDILVAPLGPAFWLGVVVVGLIAPLIIEILVERIKPKTMAPVMLVGPILVLIGSLVLRYVVVFGGQTQAWISRPPV